jgi:phospholipase C
MECWNPESLPIITTLAKNYAIFDQWHASIPGPTYGNRMFFHAATSHGVCWNTVPTDGFQIKTIYQLLDEAGYDWAFYFDQAQDASFFNYTRQPRFHDRMRTLDQFKVDSNNGNLPTLSFMLPRFFSTKDRMGDDQHPSHAVSHGESLIKRVYEELRASPSWESSAFLLTYDEHGGFYDHVPTPLHGVPNPDGRNCRKPVFFDYKRLGLRIPTILISPWVDHAVVHEPQGFMPHSTSKFEHSSFIATLTRILKLNGPLTKRDAWAAPFDYLFSRATPRTDCPLTLPPIAHPLVAEYKKAKQHQPEHLQPLHDLHISYLQATNSMVGLPRDHNIANLKTEHDAAMYIERITAEWKHKSKLAESM